MKKVLVASFVILAILAAFGAALQGLLSAPANIAEGGQLFEVHRGESTSTLAARLQDEGLVRSAMAFSLLARIEGKASRLRSGTYRIEPGMGTAAVLDLVVEGRQALQKVTIPEGLSLSETARLFDKANVASTADFMAAATDPSLLARLGVPGTSAEGYLFPDTYFMPKDYGAAKAIGELVATFRSRLAAIPEAAGLDEKALRDKVILASIIQKEYRIPDEAPIIASVFDNRLKIGMGLQSCATVVYIITERLGKAHPDVVYDKDLRIKDPFNTYLYRGLPPAPIASPGLIALRAAFEPASTKWLYFRLIDPVVGTHHFSSTFDEHLHAAQLVLKRTSGS